MLLLLNRGERLPLVYAIAPQAPGVHRCLLAVDTTGAVQMSNREKGYRLG